MSDDGTPTPPANAGGEQENATIRQMRAQIEANAKAATDAAARAEVAERALKERERAELAEVDRLKAEMADRDKQLAALEPLRDQHGRFASALETYYQAELAAAPEAAKERLERLSAQGSWADRLETLREAKALLASAMPPAAPTPKVGGTHTQPPGGPPPPAEPPAPKPFDWQNPPSWGDVLKKPATAGGTTQ